MKTLVVSYLFPNGLYPNRGVFVLNRLQAVGRHCDIKVINPIPWFPFSSRFQQYKDYSRIPRREILRGVEVYHPRFFALPIILKGFVSLTYLLAILPLVLRLRRQWKFDILSLEWTYPDFKTPPYVEYFIQLLSLYKKQIKELALAVWQQ